MRENTIFTADAAEKARPVLKKNLRNVNGGIDPELPQAGITLAGYHIERGARSFTQHAHYTSREAIGGVYEACHVSVSPAAA